MHRFIIISAHLFLSSLVFCQTNRNNEDSNLPYYNFGKGVGLTSPDSLFQFNIRFRMQNRVTYTNNEDQDPTFDGQIRRLRLRFDGYVGDPNLLYVIQLSFAPGDVGEIEEGTNLNIIRDALVTYRYKHGWTFGFGQTKLPGNRQRVNSSGALQLTDRTINNARFNIDRDFGLFINKFDEHKDAFSWNIRTSITTGDGRNFTQSPDNGLAYTGKLEIKPFGKFKNDGAYFEGDLLREQKPKLLISAAYHYNHKAKRQAGVLGDLLFESRDMSSMFIESLLKYQGFAITTVYMNRNTTSPVTENSEGQQVIIYKGAGFDLQSSYTFKNKWEIIGRYSKLTPHEDILRNFPKQNQYTLGLTKYISEHAFKLQLEATWERLIFNDGQNKNNRYLRFQVEMGI